MQPDASSDPDFNRNAGVGVNLACQEGLLPATSDLERWEFAARAGFDAIELQAGSAEEFRSRLPSLQSARAFGAVYSSVCLAGGPFIGAFDSSERARAVRRMKGLLEVAAVLGANGVVTPAAWGMFSKRLPPHTPPRTDAEDRAVLLEGLGALGEHAARLGVVVHFEPLNRYEDHMVNTLAQASSLVDELNSRGLRVLADLYHMNIEESSTPDALRDAGSRLGHVHLADNQRLEPGTGQLEFGAALRALQDVGYAGFMALECRLSGEAGVVLPRAVRFLRGSIS
jgi:sugar phosphate isomerase/epimerase